MPAVDTLRRGWIHNERWNGTQLHGREADHTLPAALCISSPDDLAAHHARQHTMPWVGDKVHLTETCEDD
jgi:transposase